jgi:hypothetical protein
VVNLVVGCRCLRGPLELKQISDVTYDVGLTSCRDRCSGARSYRFASVALLLLLLCL